MIPATDIDIDTADRKRILELFKHTPAMIERGNNISTDQYKQALYKQSLLETKLNQIFNNYDVLLSNSTAEVAGEGLNYIPNKDPSLIWSTCYVPTVNLPALAGPNHLPLGIQLVSARYRDYFLLSVCEKLSSSGLCQKVASIPDIAKP